MRAGLAPFLSGAADTRQLMGENTRKDRRTKVLSMTVRYRSATLGEFIEHHSYDVSRGGMFIKTPSPFPPGTLLKFEVKIADEQRVMQGVGRVVWKRDLDGNTPDDPAGMGIKFIKIDEASRAVIDKLVEGRAPGQEGAFEHLPEARTRMFPSTPPAEPAPEDRTVIKPATELLKDALKKTGEEPETEPGALSKEELSSEVATEKATDKAETRTSSPQEKKPVSLERKEATKKSRTSDAKARDSQARPASGQEEEGRGRAFISILVAVAVAAGIYFVTKQSTPARDQEQPEPEPAPAIQPPVEQAIPDEPELVSPQPEPASTALPIGVLAPDEEAAAPPGAIAAEPIVEPAPPAPVVQPKPRPVPKPNPPPAPKPAPAPAPTPAPVPTPEVTDAPAPPVAPNASQAEE